MPVPPPASPTPPASARATELQALFSPAPAAPAPPTALPEAPPQPATSASPDMHRLILRAVASTWVQVRQKSGHALLLRTMKPGDIWVVPLEPGLLLDTGNAEGLDLVVDGTPLQLTGATGGVVHGVSLDGDLLGSGRAVRAAH
jgi:cytoskeleton protein RodZ